MVVKIIYYIFYKKVLKNVTLIHEDMKGNDMNQNIILIGMPAAGKSTLGVLLAKAIGRSFVDTDLIIQEKTGQLLQTIINEKGLKAFKEIERKTICGHEFPHAVISTGGSVVYYNDVMERLKEEGHVIYLKLSFRTIEERLSNIHSRGLVLEQGSTLRDLYEERLPLYEKYADITVDCEELNIEESIDRIIDLLEDQND